MTLPDVITDLEAKLASIESEIENNMIDGEISAHYPCTLVGQARAYSAILQKLTCIKEE